MLSYTVETIAKRSGLLLRGKISMPTKAPHQCNYPGCRVLTTTRCCPIHTKTELKRFDTMRGTARERGYDSMWSRNSKQYLKENPLCDECYKQHRLTPATVVHHIVDHKGDYELMWDVSNWMPLCKIHHDATRKHKEKATLSGRYETR